MKKRKHKKAKQINKKTREKKNKKKNAKLKYRKLCICSLFGFITIVNVFWKTAFSSYMYYHRFRWYATLENKTPVKRFQNFCQSCVLLTDWIEIYQSHLDSMT